MTVNELYDNCRLQSPLKILDSCTGKVLCYRFNPEKHPNIGNFEIISLWSDINISGDAFSRYASPMLCAFVYRKGMVKNV